MTEPPEPVPAPTRPEARGIELIDPSRRHGTAKGLFTVWAAPMVSVLNLTIGASLTVLLGLEIRQAVLVLLAASLLWVFPGIVAVSGPSAGTAGSVVQRAIYGIRGNRIVIAFYGWFIAGVFLALNWVASSYLGAELLLRTGMENGTLALVIVTVAVSAVTVLVAVYGHDLILRSYAVVTVVLLVVFLAATAYILPHVDWSYSQPEPLTGTGLWSSLTIAFAILASTPLSFSNSADIARYLPETTRPSSVIAATALGGALPCFLFTAIGILLGSVVTGDAVELGIEFALLETLPGWLVPAFVIAVVVNTISLNGMTTYTASMAFQSIGVPIRRIPSAVVIGALGTLFTVYLVLSTSLLDAVNLMLQLVLVISAPTMAVYATDIVLRRNRYRGGELFEENPGGRYWYRGGFGIAGLTSVVAGGTAAALFLATDVWVGPLSAALGYVDLAVPAGMLVASLLYVLLAGRTVRAQAAS